MWLNNPNWQEADQMAIYEHDYQEQHQLVIRAGLKVVL